MEKALQVKVLAAKAHSPDPHGGVYYFKFS